MDEIRLALRRLRRRPGAAAASVVALACGIGATAATWSLLSAVLLTPLPISSPESLVVVEEHSETRDGTTRTNTGLLYTTVQAISRAGIFDGVAATGHLSFLVTVDGDTRLRDIDFVSGEYFSTLGVQPIVGRALGPEDDRRGGPLVAVLSHQFWRAHFGGDADVVGREIRVSDLPAVVVGVAPPRFRGVNLAQAPELYMPLEAVGAIGTAGNVPFNFYDEPNTGTSPSAWITSVGRLPVGRSAVDVTARLNQLGKSIGRRRDYGVIPAATAAIPETAREAMSQFGRLLLVTVGLLLVIACATVGMLLLTRIEARRGELAMRRALGATRGRLALGVIVEGAVLAVGGALLALPAASWLFHGIQAFELPGRIAVDVLDLSIDAGVLRSAAGLAVGAALSIAVVAGVFGSSAQVTDILRSHASATPRVTRRGTRTALVACQIAVAVVLLAGTGLLVRSLSAALSLNPGFDTDRVVMGGTQLYSLGYDTQQSTTFAGDLRDRLEASGTISSVSIMVRRGAMGPGGTIVVDGQDRQFPSMVGYEAIDDRYFDTLGLRLIEGREFTAADGAGAAPVTIVSESFGRLLANGASPIGHHVRGSSRRIGEPWPQYEVVGVVPDLIDRVTDLEPLRMYFPLAQHPGAPALTVVFRPAGSVSAATREVTANMKAIEPRVIAPTYQTIDDRIRAQMAPQRFGMTVLGALGGIAALLTALGIYVVASGLAAARRREMGIRGALGASRRQLGALMLSETGRLAGAGIALGLGLAWLGAGTIASFLYQVEPLDPTTLGVVCGGVLLLAILVSLRSVIGTARIDLARVLRDD